MENTASRAKVIAVANQKGGVGKTTTTSNLGIGLARQGKKVLLIDADAQGNLTSCMGIDEPDELEHTLADIMNTFIAGDAVEPDYALMEHEENVTFVPGNIELSGVEVTLVNSMSREYVLKEYISVVAPYYDYILIDCMPSLGMMTINALAAADSVLIPVQAQFLSLKGLQQLIVSILKVKKKLNPKLSFEGILLTMVDARTNFAKDIMGLVHENYGSRIPVFDNYIPLSVRAAETTAEGKSIFKHDPRGKVAAAYDILTREVLAHAG